MNNKELFARWFRQATGNEPYPFQIRFACETTLPELVDVPMGMGKIAVECRDTHQHERLRLSGN